MTAGGAGVTTHVMHFMHILILKMVIYSDKEKRNFGISVYTVTFDFLLVKCVNKIFFICIINKIILIAYYIIELIGFY